MGQVAVNLSPPLIVVVDGGVVAGGEVVDVVDEVEGGAVTGTNLFGTN